MADFHYEYCGKNQDILSVVISGELDAGRCDYLFGCMEHLIAGGVSRMILDCTNLQLVSSVGLGMLVRVHARMKRIGGDVKLVGIQGVTASVIALAHLDRVFQMFPTLDEAIEAHGG